MGVISGTYHHRQIRANFIHMFQNLDGGVLVVISDHQCFGTHESCCQQYFPFGGVTIHDTFARRHCLPYPIGVEIESNIAGVFLLHEMRQRLATAPVTTNNDVRVGGYASHRDLMNLHGTIHPCIGGNTAYYGFGMLNQERCNQHGKQHGRQHVLHDCIGQNIDLASQCQQHEPKFSRLRQPQTTTNCGPPIS